MTTQVNVRKVLRGLPRGTGVLVINPPPGADSRQLRRLAESRDLEVLVEDHGRAKRVHNLAELRGALLARAEPIFLSPIYPTASHPEWRPIPWMRAAAMARLAGRNLLALGGMDERRFRRIRPLGFVGWGGVSAWKRRKPRT